MLSICCSVSFWNLVIHFIVFTGDLQLQKNEVAKLIEKNVSLDAKLDEYAKQKRIVEVCDFVLRMNNDWVLRFTIENE